MHPWSFDIARFLRLARADERLSEVPAGLHGLAFVLFMPNRFVHQMALACSA
jgi:hypothetical protein